MGKTLTDISQKVIGTGNYSQHYSSEKYESKLYEVNYTSVTTAKLKFK